jgi:hypothetical protein
LLLEQMDQVNQLSPMQFVFVWGHKQELLDEHQTFNHLLEKEKRKDIFSKRITIFIIYNRFRSAELTIILANEGPEAFKPELYGKEIQIIRRIGIRKSSYKILGNIRINSIEIHINSSGTNQKIISKRKETIDEITQALSISPENPLCVLHQEIAKTFLINSDSRKKYQVKKISCFVFI